MNTFETADRSVKDTYAQLNEIAVNVCTKYCNKVDAIVYSITDIDELDNREIRHILAELAIEAYRLADYAERSSLKSECAIALHKEMQANVYINSTGTQGNRNNQALLESQPEQLVSILYKNIRSVLVTKVNETHRIESMLNSVLISRATEAKLANL